MYDSDENETASPHTTRTPSFRGSRRCVRQREDQFVPWKAKYDKEKHSISSFLTWFDNHVGLNQYTDSEKCAQLLLSFGIETPKIVRKLPDPYNYHALLKAVAEFYEPLTQRRSFRATLRDRSRKASETPRQFAEELEELCLKAFPGEPVDVMSDRLLDLFLQHQDNSAKSALAIKDPQTMEDAVNFLESYEIATRKNKNTAPPEEPKPSPCPAVSVNQAQRVPPIHPLPSVSPPGQPLESLMDSLVDETVYEVNCTSMLTQPDGSVEDPTDFVSLLATKVNWRVPEAQTNPACLYCGLQNHDETTCYKLIRRLHQRGFDITRYRPNPASSRLRPQPQWSPPMPPVNPQRFAQPQTSYPTPYFPATQYRPATQYAPRPQVYGLGQSPWSQRHRFTPKPAPSAAKPPPVARSKQTDTEEASSYEVAVPTAEVHTPLNE